MKTTEIFDECYARYRSLQTWLADSTGSVRSLDIEKPSSGYHWRPCRAQACEYVADFERIGRNALRRAEWKGRLKLFNVYFVDGVQYRPAIKLMGVAEGTFDYWYQEVKKAAGAEFARTELFPPSRYFQKLSLRVLASTEEKIPDQGDAHGEGNEQDVLHHV